MAKRQGEGGGRATHLAVHAATGNDVGVGGAERNAVHVVGGFEADLIVSVRWALRGHGGEEEWKRLREGGGQGTLGLMGSEKDHNSTRGLLSGTRAEASTRSSKEALEAYDTATVPAMLGLVGWEVSRRSSRKMQR